MRLWVFSGLAVLYMCVAVFFPLYWHMQRETCLVVTSPVTQQLYADHFNESVALVQRITGVRCVVCADDDDTLIETLLRTKAHYVVITGERLNILQKIKGYTGATPIAAVLYRQSPVHFDVDLTVTPDYQRTESVMRQCFRDSGVQRPFVFASGESEAPFSLLSDADSDYAAGLVTTMAPQYLPENTVFYADPGFLGLLPGIIMNFRKDVNGSASVVPIIKKM